MSGLGGFGGMGGLGGGGGSSQQQQQQEQMRLMEMMQEMQVTDSLRMYNELVQRCFTQCVDSFRSRKLDGKEVCSHTRTRNCLSTASLLPPYPSTWLLWACRLTN